MSIETATISGRDMQGIAGGSPPPLMQRDWFTGVSWREVTPDEFVALAATRDVVAVLRYGVSYPSSHSGTRHEVFTGNTPGGFWGWGLCGTFGQRSTGFRTSMTPDAIVRADREGEYRGTFRYFAAE